jgi:hypothetical protein
MWSVNGLAPSQQLPSSYLAGILDILAEDVFGRDNAWTETTVDSLTIHVLADGEYRARSVTTSYVVRADAYERRLRRRVQPGQDVVRDKQAPQVRESTGTWSVKGDSIYLTQTRRQIIAEYAATDLRIVSPEKSQRADAGC